MASREYKAALGPQMKFVHEWSGLGVIELAEMTGIGITTLYEYWRGVKAPDAERLARLAHAYGLSVDQVIGRQALPGRVPARNH